MADTKQNIPALKILVAVLIVLLAVAAISWLFFAGPGGEQAGTKVAATGRETSSRITGKSGSTKIRDFKEQALPVKVSGFVLSADDKSPVPGSKIIGSVLSKDNVVRWRDVTRSNVKGFYEINPCVPSGGATLVLAAQAPEWLQTDKKVVLSAGTDLENVDIFLANATNITIVLRDAQDNSGVSGAVIDFKRSDEQESLPVAEASEVGSYFVEYVSLGTYNIWIYAEGYATVSCEICKVTKSAQVFEFTLQKGGSISGRVCNPEGNPIVDAEIMFRLVGGVVLSNTSAHDGYYVINGIRESLGGEISAKHPEYAKCVDAIIKLKKGENKTHIITMTRGVKIIGSVVDLNNKPVPGVKVSMTPGHYHSALVFSGTTDNEGGFVFERVAPEEYHFTLLAPAFHIKNVDHFYVSSDKKEVRARFVMKRGAVISGWAVDTGGNALCGVIVRTKGRNNFKRSTKTDESGFFSIGGLFNNQKYTVEFIPDNHAYKKIENVRGGASVGEVALFAYGLLKGMVTWTGGPVSGAEIHVRPVNDPAIIYAWYTDADGSFLRESLKPNTYRLKIKAEGFMEYVNDKIIIKEGRLLDIGEIRLKQ